MTDRANSVRRTIEIANRRERRRRRLTLAAFTFILIALALFAGYLFWLRDSSLVEIRELEIRGVEAGTVEGRQISEAVEVAVGEMTTLHVKQGLLDEETSRFPRVESASIETDFPNGAVVTVRLRQDGSIFGEGSDALLIATDGTVLGSPGDQADALPVIGAGDPPEGGRLEGRTLNQAIVLGAVPRELRSFVDRSDVGRDGVEVTLSNGLILLFGDSAAAGEKWNAAATVIADPELSDAGYVDLTVPRRPAVGSGDGPDQD